MDPLIKNRVGTIELWVTCLGLGRTPCGGLYRDIAEDVAIATVQRALQIGINFFDTAPLYGCGKSELRLTGV